VLSGLRSIALASFEKNFPTARERARSLRISPMTRLEWLSPKTALKEPLNGVVFEEGLQ
jgi:hypothetical protein